jgi:hypothetical protein
MAGLGVALFASGAHAQSGEAKDAALSWLGLIDHGAYADSWSRAGSLFRSHGGASDWAAKIGPARRPLGAVVSRALARQSATASLPGAPDGIYEILQFSTRFAAKAGAAETVVLAREKDGWKVDGYFIK